MYFSSFILRALLFPPLPDFCLFMSLWVQAAHQPIVFVLPHRRSNYAGFTRSLGLLIAAWTAHFIGFFFLRKSETCILAAQLGGGKAEPAVNRYSCHSGSYENCFVNISCSRTFIFSALELWRVSFCFLALVLVDTDRTTLLVPKPVPWSSVPPPPIRA